LHGHLKAITIVGEPIEVSVHRKKGGDSDPLMLQIREKIEAMLEELKTESTMYVGAKGSP
jgi:hypothetical protein